MSFIRASALCTRIAAQIHGREAPDATARMGSRPPLSHRIWSALGFGWRERELTDWRNEEAPGLPERFHTDTIIVADWKDRLRFLISGKAVVEPPGDRFASAIKATAPRSAGAAPMNKLVTGVDMPKDLLAVLQKYGLPNDGVIGFKVECEGPQSLLEITAKFYGHFPKEGETFADAEETRTLVVVDKNAEPPSGSATLWAQLCDLVTVARQFGLLATADQIVAAAERCRLERRSA